MTILQRDQAPGPAISGAAGGLVSTNANKGTHRGDWAVNNLLGSKQFGTQCHRAIVLKSKKYRNSGRKYSIPSTVLEVLVLR